MEIGVEVAKVSGQLSVPYFFLNLSHRLSDRKAVVGGRSRIRKVVEG